jgi:DNA-binding MarR family transcriptional regulator
METSDGGVTPLRDRFGYLLKHVRARLAELTSEALRPLGVSGQEVGVLTVLDAGRPPSQLEAAQRLGIDRTTMVGLIDALEAKGLVERRADDADRRRNIVALTGQGHQTLRDAARATDAAEATFLAGLSLEDRGRLRAMLQAIAEDDPSHPVTSG